MAEFTSGFNISEDLALNEKFWDLYGFKKCEFEGNNVMVKGGK
jgi:hypothetical protein